MTNGKYQFRPALNALEERAVPAWHTMYSGPYGTVKAEYDTSLSGSETIRMEVNVTCPVWVLGVNNGDNALYRVGLEIPQEEPEVLDWQAPRLPTDYFVFDGSNTTSALFFSSVVVFPTLKIATLQGGWGNDDAAAWLQAFVPSREDPGQPGDGVGMYGFEMEVNYDLLGWRDPAHYNWVYAVVHTPPPANQISAFRWDDFTDSVYISYTTYPTLATTTGFTYLRYLNGMELDTPQFAPGSHWSASVALDGTYTVTYTP